MCAAFRRICSVVLALEAASSQCAPLAACAPDSVTVRQKLFRSGAQVLETLTEWCDAQLARYATAVQNDQSELKEEKTSWLRQQALRALISEKQTLMGLQRQTRDRMQQLKEGCPLETLYV